MTPKLLNGQKKVNANDSLTREYLSWSLIILTLCLVLSQVVWMFQGHARDYLQAPQWVTWVRGFGFVQLLLSLAFSSKRIMKLQPSQKTMVTTLTILAGSSLVLPLLFNQNVPKLTSVFGYLFLGFLILRSGQNSQLLQWGSFISLRIVVWGSLLFAMIKPSYAFVSAVQRIRFATQGNRLSGVVGDANLLAFLAIIFLIFVVYAKKRSWKYDVVASFLVLILTDSRTALLSAVAVLIVLFLAFRAPSLIRPLALVLIISSIVVLIVALSKPVSFSAASGQDLLNSRPLIWSWALDRWRESPWFGIGLSTYQNELNSSPYVFWAHAHNQWLQDLILGGVIRLSIVIFFLKGFLTFAFQSLKSQNALPTALILALISESTTEVPLFVDTINFRFLALVCIFVIANYSRENVDLSFDKYNPYDGVDPSKAM